ncbi:hypothetical protein NM208_g10443 [Fusarium decemcellulare]|uniref:Uncharacterized protein n=1 Tax=Fusarium decemcellulare TaxID=57161 RepID=A0ACC1RXY3_9HYPO|nr:hypothetical protein NM208_g10443 [Fusarium decemcellulare]
MKLPFALLAFTAFTDASPILSERGEPWEDVKTLCEWSTKTPEEVARVWEQTAAGVQLELFIKSHWQHQTSWLMNLESVIAGPIMGQSDAAGCGVLGESTCAPNRDMPCEVQYAKFGASPLGSTSYWIFRAVKGAHKKFKELDRVLVVSTLMGGLQIPSLLRQWGGAVGGLAPGAGTSIGAGFGFLSGLFAGLAAEAKPEDIKAGTLQDSLIKALEASRTKLKNTLRIAMGGGTSEEEFNSSTGGWYLLNDDAAAVAAAFESVGNNVKTKIINEVMKSVGLHLVADTRPNVDTQEKCGYAPGRQWMELKDGQFYCFYLMRSYSTGYKEPDWEEAGEIVYAKMAEYKLGNRDAYYRALINCALSGGGEVDPATLVWNEVPHCYFNLPAVFVKNGVRGDCASEKKDCGYVQATPLA